MGSESVEKAAAQQTPSHKLTRSLPKFFHLHFQRIKYAAMDLNWVHLAFKACAYSYILFLLWVTWGVWRISPFATSTVRQIAQSDRIPMMYQDVRNHFQSFKGSTTCAIHPTNLYSPPTLTKIDEIPPKAYCHDRSSLLEAMSSGGRIGFDAPYMSRGCSYRWFTVEEICTILERFDAVQFLGDQTLQTIYAGFNVLLRMDLQHGAMRIWEIPTDKLSSCHCNNQFTNPSCHEHFVQSSDEVIQHVGGKHMNSYACQRTPHAMLRLDKSPASKEIIAKFHSLVQPAPQSNYKPIPIIHSLTSAASIELASDSLIEFMKLADDSGRKTPMLWVGPTAAGHIDMNGRKGNQEIWYFAREMAKFARARNAETLGLWNLTVQAESWDGKSFGEEVNLVEAMMVINWLSRLESS